MGAVSGLQGLTQIHRGPGPFIGAVSDLLGLCNINKAVSDLPSLSVTHRGFKRFIGDMGEL